MDVQVNYLAVLLAAISSMVVGAIWYAPNVMGNTWMRLVGIKRDHKPTGKEMAPLLTLTFVGSLITAYVLAHVSFISNKFFGNSFFQDSVTTALWLWLGLTAVRFAVHDLFEGRRRKLTLLNISNELVTLLVMAMIIGWLHP